MPLMQTAEDLWVRHYRRELADGRSIDPAAVNEDDDVLAALRAAQERGDDPFEGWVTTEVE